MPKQKQNKYNKDYWENIFNEVEMEYIPIQYVNTVIVQFSDDVVWEIDMSDRDQSDDPGADLDDFFQEYEDSIKTVDFRLDLEKIKKDVSKRTHRFLKLNK